MPDNTLHRAGGAAERAAVNKTNKYNYLLSNYIFVPLACEISGVWCIEGIDFLNELVAVLQLSLVTKVKHIIFSKDCQLRYRKVMQFVSVYVFLLLTSAMINTPPSATPNYIHPQYLMPTGT